MTDKNDFAERVARKYCENFVEDPAEWPLWRNTAKAWIRQLETIEAVREEMAREAVKRLPTVGVTVDDVKRLISDRISWLEDATKEKSSTPERIQSLSSRVLEAEFILNLIIGSLE